MIGRVFGPSALHLNDKLQVNFWSGCLTRRLTCQKRQHVLLTTSSTYVDLLMSQDAARSGKEVDMEACFSQLTLDVIGKAVFNYDFDALNTDSPLIQVALMCQDQPIQKRLASRVGVGVAHFRDMLAAEHARVWLTYDMSAPSRRYTQR